VPPHQSLAGLRDGSSNRARGYYRSDLLRVANEKHGKEGFAKKRGKLAQREEAKRVEEERLEALAKAAAAPPGDPDGGLTHHILAIAVSRPGNSSNSSKMLLLEADTGEPLEEEHDAGFVTCVALSPDGKSLAWAAFSDRPGRTETDFVTLWDVPSGKARAYLCGHDR